MDATAQLFASLVRLLADPKTSEAVIAIAKEAVAFGIGYRNRLMLEGGWDHVDALERFDKAAAVAFSEMHARHMADGVFSDAERLEQAQAWDAMVIAMKSLP